MEDSPTALNALIAATQADPPRLADWQDLVLAAAKSGDLKQALVYCDQALTHHATDAALLRHRANLLYALGDAAGSEQTFRKVIDLYPDDTAAWINLGMVLKQTRRFAEAETCYRQAIILGDAARLPQAHFNLANLLLQQGKWREGFAAFEWRRKLAGAMECPLPLPVWTPDLPPGSRVLVWNDQGLGDAIMFARFAAALAQKNHRLFLYGQKSLQGLAALSPSIETALTPLDDLPTFDAALPLCSLPHALDILSPDAWNKPYLQAPSVSVIGSRQSPARRIGIVWAGSANHANNARRSMRLDDFAPLFALPDIEWFNLQLDRAEELRNSPHRDRITDLSPRTTDLTMAAAAMKELDLVISVDTAPAHLAGALGVTVWTLLPAAGGDWRWGADTDHTIWYPSMRLFRQQQPGDWAQTIDAVCAALLEF